MPPPPSPTTLPPLRILFLHGYTQSGALFHSKTGALRKALTTAFAPRPLELIFPTGPLSLNPEDVPGYQPSPSSTSNIEETTETFGWWKRKDPSVSGENPVYEGLDQTLALIAQEIKKQPFDGVVGFSQGACLAGMLASIFDSSSSRSRQEAFVTQESSAGMPFPQILLSPENGQLLQQPFKFAVMYSGFRAPGETYRAFWEPAIQVRSLHVLGGLDTVVDEERSLALVDGFAEDLRRVVTHPGGHFVPSGKIWLGAVVGFVREAMSETGDSTKAG